MKEMIRVAGFAAVLVGLVVALISGAAPMGSISPGIGLLIAAAGALLIAATGKRRVGY